MSKCSEKAIAQQVLYLVSVRNSSWFCFSRNQQGGASSGDAVVKLERIAEYRVTTNANSSFQKAKLVLRVIGEMYQIEIYNPLKVSTKKKPKKNKKKQQQTTTISTSAVPETEACHPRLELAWSEADGRLQDTRVPELHCAQGLWLIFLRHLCRFRWRRSFRERWILRVKRLGSRRQQQQQQRQRCLVFSLK